eukprot:12482294-Alexandrium_andersonii.AAC.1
MAAVSCAGPRVGHRSTPGHDVAHWICAMGLRTLDVVHACHAVRNVGRWHTRGPASCVICHEVPVVSTGASPVRA